MIAHDMRTPLSALTMSLQVIRQNIQPELVPQLDVAIRNADALAKIIEVLVDSAATGQGKLSLCECLPVNLVASAIDQIAPLAEAKEQCVTTGELVALPPLVADSTRVIRILVNLLSNAVRFTPVGGQIKIDAKKRCNDGHESIVFSVCDNGPGVKIEDIERIFTAGVSIAKGEKYSSGLGLAVCRELVEAHQGRIWIDQNQSKGAVFSFAIPTGLTPTHTS